MKELQIYVVGEVGSGKSALIGIIEDRLKDLGIKVLHEQPNEAEYERNMVNGEWEDNLKSFLPMQVTMHEKGDVPKLEITQIPTTCDGLEQSAFEKRFAALKYSMDQHPMFYIFSDDKTAAAREGWREAIEYVHGRMSAALTENLKKRQGAVSLEEKPTVDLKGKTLKEYMDEQISNRREAKQRFFQQHEKIEAVVESWFNENFLSGSYTESYLTELKHAIKQFYLHFKAEMLVDQTNELNGWLLSLATMPTLPSKNFVQLCEEAALQYATHRHYKGGLYRQMTVAKHTETEEEVVVYIHLYPHPVHAFVRPKEMFEGTLEDGTVRFAEISAAEKINAIPADINRKTPNSSLSGSRPVAYTEGQVAQLLGKKRDENPYISQAGQKLDEEQWDKGWNDSKEVDSSENAAQTEVLPQEHQEGQAACREGKARNENPYANKPDQENASYLWDRGWVFASWVDKVKKK